jgi:hypothetical protein
VSLRVARRRFPEENDPRPINPQDFPLRGPKGALRAARYARGRRYAACTSTAPGQMHMPTHIMKAGKGEPLQLHSEERGIVLLASGRLRADGNAKHPRRGGVSSRV